MSFRINIGNITGGGQNLVIRNGTVISGGSTTNRPQGNGEAKGETREITESFDRIDVSALDGVKIASGSQPFKGVVLKGDSNYLEGIETKVEDGTLHIGPSGDGALNSKTPFSATIFMGDLTGISASAGASVEASNLMLQSLKVKASSGSEVKVAGQVQDLKVNSSSGSEVDVKSVDSHSASVKASSGAEVKVGHVESLKAEASSGAKVWYLSGGSVDRSTSSGGVIAQL